MFVVTERTQITQRFERTGAGAENLNICIEMAEAYHSFHPSAQVVVFRYKAPNGFNQDDRRLAQFGPSDPDLYEREYGQSMPITGALSDTINNRQSDWF